jgi:penicillin-binding protein 1A
MRGVHGISVAGGTFPAAIWHDFMMVAKRDDCRPFAPPKEPVKFTPFFGKYSTTAIRPKTPQGGQRHPAQAPKATEDDSERREDQENYAPRLYDSPPQKAPGGTPTPEVPGEAPVGPGTPGGGVEPESGGGNGNAKGKKDKD